MAYFPVLGHLQAAQLLYNTPPCNLLLNEQEPIFTKEEQRPRIPMKQKQPESAFLSDINKPCTWFSWSRCSSREGVYPL